MARAPRAKVFKSSGQGVSRKAYQSARAIAGDARVGIKSEFTSGDGGGNSKSYAKSSIKSDYPKGFDVSYARSLPINDIGDVKALGERKPPKPGVKDTRKNRKIK